MCILPYKMIVFTFFKSAVVLYTLSSCAQGRSSNQYKYDIDYVHDNSEQSEAESENEQPELSTNYWKYDAQITLLQHLHRRPNTNVARNVIMFLGDGMSIPTLTAARTYYGQQQGKNGEESRLSFEDFPYVGLSKTYCVDNQVADSACSATAYLCGVKANYGTIGVNARVKLDDYVTGSEPQNHVNSIASWAQQAGKATGIVTTTRITHASPAGTYAHTANRDWECDADVPDDFCDEYDLRCQDIASQLIFNEPGRNFNVILGGGRAKFYPDTAIDSTNNPGQRKDGNNLIYAWQRMKGSRGRYVTEKTDLMTLNVNNTDYVLGLFNADHNSYNLDADHGKEPSLSEMTVAAIRMLKGNKNGYFLFVEGGRIDHAHHENKARKALDETVQLAEAVRVANEMTSDDDTLIVVTSDHAHTMSISGYSRRGDDILGLNGDLSNKDHMPYSTLNYATGPAMMNGSRSYLSSEYFDDKDFQYPVLVPLKSAAHGGDDVAVFATGPWAHLFTGIYEQNVIPHFMAFASCIGDELTACNG